MLPEQKLTELPTAKFAFHWLFLRLHYMITTGTLFSYIDHYKTLQLPLKLHIVKTEEPKA